MYSTKRLIGQSTGRLQHTYFTLPVRVVQVFAATSRSMPVEEMFALLATILLFSAGHLHAPYKIALFFTRRHSKSIMAIMELQS